MRAVLVVVVAALAVLFARPAQGHSDVVASSPQAGSTVTTAPSEITLTFADAIRGRFSTVVVTGPDGARYGSGAPRAVDRTLHQPVKPLVAGEYTVAWRVVSGDGHPRQGVFSFTADVPATVPTSAAPQGPPAAPSQAAPSSAAFTAAAVAADGDGGGSGLFVAAAGAGVLVVIAGVVVLTRRRRTP